MKFFLFLLAGFMYTFTASALMADPGRIPNEGAYVPYNCAVEYGKLTLCAQGPCVQGQQEGAYCQAFLPKTPDLNSQRDSVTPLVSGCLQWNDGCHTCKTTDEGYVCPPKNCATMRAGYCEVDRSEVSVQPFNPDQIVPPVPEPPSPAIPENCTSWYDGCNTCGVKNGRLTFCTERACVNQSMGEPYCKAFADKKNVDSVETIGEVLTVTIGSELVRCDAFRQTCMVMDGKPFDGWIDGFEPQTGFIYQLRIRKTKLPRPVLDMGSYRYELVEVVSKEPAITSQAVETTDFAEPVMVELEPQAEPSFWGFVKYHLFGWMK